MFEFNFAPVRQSIALYLRISSFVLSFPSFVSAFFSSLRRVYISVDFYVDGKDYFERIYDEFIHARDSMYPLPPSSIIFIILLFISLTPRRFIFDWMFSHDTNLIRPASLPEHQLGNLLIQKATSGVKVRILLYNSILSPLFFFPIEYSFF